jgi:hypothetical protein
MGNTLVLFYLSNCLIEEAVRAAELRGRALDKAELKILGKALSEKKNFKSDCYELARILSQEGLIMEAASAASLAGRDLGSQNINSIRQYIASGQGHRD